MGKVNELQKHRSELISQIQSIESEEVLAQLKAYLEELADEGDFWDRLSDAHQKHIESGMADTDAGRHKSAEDVMAKYGL